ncbi:MAG: hypothetical protein K6D03_02790 [Solobacterium sp.]|nr:hypothetical protein [Solobacterium sp.]
MKVKIVYPEVTRQQRIWMNLRIYCKWIFLFASTICAAVNISVGGKAWSVIAIWSMWIVWSQILSTDMVEYNRLSQTVKLILRACVLLAMIDLFLAPGWSVNVIALVCTAAVILVGVLFFSDFEKQKQNMFPMLIFCVLCFTGSVIGLIARRGRAVVWPLAVLAVCSVFLLVLCAAFLGNRFGEEIRKRFSVK